MSAISMIQPSNQRYPVHFGRFSFANIEAEVARNEVLSRVMIEALGFTPWRMMLGRNKYERIEAFMDTAVWFLIGFALPLAIQAPIAKYVNRKLAKQYKLLNKKPLEIGLQHLEASQLTRWASRQQLAKRLGLKTLSKLPLLIKTIAMFKIGMIFLDLAFMSAKQFSYFWGRNKFTEWYSHKKGFSGEFNTATQKQLENNANAIAESKLLRSRISTASGLLYPIVLPALLWAGVRSKTIWGKGVVGNLKKLLPAFNYHRSIYMTKWVVMWNCILGWNLIGLMSARDKHERREHLTRCAVVDFFYFMGDDFFAGLAGKYFQQKYKRQLGSIKLYKTIAGFPVGKGLDELRDEAAKVGKKSVAKIVENLARWNFRIGIITTALFLGIGITAANNWFTKKKLLQEQAGF